MPRAPGTAIRAAGMVVIAIVVIAIGCRGRATAPIQALVDEPDRFPHDRHRTLACDGCHPVDAVRTGVVTPPGTGDHAPCDQGQCHRDAFLAAPGPMCRICHVSVSATGGPSPLQAYPREGGLRALPARFSHAAHLDVGAVERTVGFHVVCADCHAPAGEERPRDPGHAECARCHAAEAGLSGGPDMTQCDGCHLPLAGQARHRRVMITGDLSFDHASHRGDARGQRIPCGTCHADTGSSATASDHKPPAIAVCVACHDDSDRVPANLGMRSCEACHATIDTGIGKLAPRDHLPATERPLDHTLAFRKDHGAEARDAPQRCAACHTQLSGSRHAACDECHQTLRPQDHTVTWRELDHGAEADADRDRCATCHVVDQCEACHQRTPRSHLATPRFRDTGHGELARANPRACLTCHAPQTSCALAGCHPMGAP